MSTYADKLQQSRDTKQKVKQELDLLSLNILKEIDKAINLEKDLIYEKLDAFLHINYLYYASAVEIRNKSKDPSIEAELRSLKQTIDDFRYDLKSLSQVIMNENNNAL
jgi:hypothetical protein